MQIELSKEGFVIIKKGILFLLGFIPFVLGIQMNAWLMKNQNSVLPFKLIGLIFLGFWVFVGFRTCKFAKTPLKSAIIANLPAFVVLLLVMYQEIILGHYWLNIFGIATQFYYLPLLNLSFSLSFWIHSVRVAYVIGFLLMFASYYYGAYLKTRREVNYKYDLN